MSLISHPFPAMEKPRTFAFPGWSSVLTPTLSDFFFVALLVWLFAAGPHGWIGLLEDGDTGWHIRTGEYVLDHGRVPAEDLFSFSKEGQTWFAWEWLADVLLASAWRQAGMKGVVLLAGVVITVAAFLVFRTMLWRGANSLLAMLVALLGVGASSVHHLARPHVFTLLFMSVGVWILARDRQAPTPWVWTLIPLTAVWTNLHGGFVALIVTCGLLAGGELVEAWIGPAGRAERLAAARRHGILTAGCALASLLNPFGYRLHLHVASYLKSDWIRKAVQEFQSPSFRDESMLQFEALLLVGLLAAAACLRRSQVVEALWILFWAHAALGSVRHVTIYVIVAAPLAAIEMTRWWEWMAGRGRANSVASILKALGDDSASAFRRTTIWTVLPVVALVFLDEPVKWPKNFRNGRFPVDMVERHREQLAGARVLTSDQWADYLIYRSYPRQRVFLDGRSDFYGPDLGQEYVQLMQAHWNWSRLMDRHRFEYALTPMDWPLAAVLKQDRRWRILGDDGGAILFERVDRSGFRPKVDPEKKARNGLMKTTEAAESTRGDHRG